MKTLKMFWLTLAYSRLYLRITIRTAIIWGAPADVEDNDARLAIFRPREWRRLQAMLRLTDQWARGETGRVK